MITENTTALTFHFSDPSQLFSDLILTYIFLHFHLLATAINYILNDSENA
jgi:hypothetical protein